MAALVTDARYRMSLAVIRSLGLAGVKVVAQEEKGIAPLDALGFHSRHTSEKLLTASPREQPGAFVDDLLEFASTRSKGGEGGPGFGVAGRDVLIPVSLASIEAIAARIDEVRQSYDVALPPLESVRIANDTQRLLRIAEQAGVPAPETVVLGPGEDPEPLVDRIKFPVVIKYREGEELGLPPEQRYAIVRDPAKFPQVYRTMAARQESPLVQRFIPGDGWGMSAILDGRSEPVAVFCHRRLREYPVSGGPSCFCESVREEEMIDYGLRLLKELHWHGVAMVEFKREFATGEFVLMEINPRFWGSLPLAIAAGVDFPHILYRVARGEEVSPVTEYKVGVKMRYLFQDFLSVRGYLRRVPRRGVFVGWFLKDLFNPHVVDGVFRLNDPVPGLTYAVRAVGKAVRKSGGEE